MYVFFLSFSLNLLEFFFFQTDFIFTLNCNEASSLVVGEQFLVALGDKYQL